MENIDSYSDADFRAAAIRAVLFFDLFDYPLTAYEIWRYLEIPSSLSQIVSLLDEGISGIEHRSGFYFVSGRDKIVLERIRRYNVSREKLRLAKRSIRLLRHLPGIKFIGIANLIGAHNWRPNSDIDLLIISSPGRIWTSRFFAAGLMKILKRRPQGINKANKICLSFYATANHLDFSGLRLNSFDPYFTYWLADLLPVYGHGIYPRLIMANSWLSRELPNWQPDIYSSQVTGVISGANFFSRWLERGLKRWQLAIMPSALKSPTIGSGVVINDQILKLYVIDRRPEIAGRFIQKYENFRSAY